MKMRLLNSAHAVARLTLAAVREWPSRPIDTLVTILGFATVAGILAAVLAMAGGYRHVFDSAAQSRTIIVLSEGSNSEWSSSIPASAVGPLMQAPGVARKKGTPLIAESLLGHIKVRYRRRNLSAKIVLRGVSPQMLSMDRHLHIEKGRWFRPGLNEIVVGAAAAGDFRGLSIGEHVQAQGTRWTVVGEFSAGAQFFSSEAWTSLGSLQGAEHARGVSSLYVQLASPRAFSAFRRALAGNTQTPLHALRQSTYFARQASGMSTLITRVGGFFTLLMGAAAVFGAMSTLLIMVESRRMEVAMLRALGYPHGIVFTATLLEGVLLGCAGGVLGALAVYASLNGYSASTLSIGGHMAVSNHTPQVFFHFRVGEATMFKAVVWSLAMGLIGGVYPALRAARMPIAAALRDG